MDDYENKLIVALDVETFDEARVLIDQLSEVVNVFKVGSQLFTACGPVVIRYLLAKKKKVFLDLKFHDIPNTVANAVSSAVSLAKPGHSALDEQNKQVEFDESVFMCTLHTIGGKEMCQRAAEAAAKKAENIGVTKPLLVGITVLTSEEKTDNILAIILERAKIAKEAGLDGVVASSLEAEAIRREFGENFVIVTPGIRPKGADAGDQKRITTPFDAISNGSNFLVVGRPILQAKNPLESAKNILEEIKQAQNA